MSSISQMTPEEIYKHLLSRIEKTNMLYGLLDSDSSIELTNVIFFKYYFDFSTAIEAIIRGIAFEESKKHTYIKFSAVPQSEHKPYFIKYNELKALINNIDNLFLYAKESDFKSIIFDKIAALKCQKITKKFINNGSFKYDYDDVRKIRNSLAHGLITTSDVIYSISQLETFSFICYLLLTYYKKLYRE